MIDPLTQAIIRRTIMKVIGERKDTPKEQLEKIVKGYESAPLHKKIIRFFWEECSEEQFTYLFARDTLNGSFNYEKWKKDNDKDIKLEEERQKSIEKEKLEERIRLENIKKGKKVELFPGSLKEYKTFKKAKYEIIDTGKKEKFIEVYDRIDCDFESMGRLGVDALVRFQGVYTDDCFQGYGIPVKKKG